MEDDSLTLNPYLVIIDQPHILTVCTLDQSYQVIEDGEQHLCKELPLHGQQIAEGNKIQNLGDGKIAVELFNT